MRIKRMFFKCIYLYPPFFPANRISFNCYKYESYYIYPFPITNKPTTKIFRQTGYKDSSNSKKGYFYRFGGTLLYKA